MLFVVLTAHAETRMLNRHISYDDVLDAVNNGSVREQEYPKDTFAIIFKGLKVVVGAPNKVITAYRLK